MNLQAAGLTFANNADSLNVASGALQLGSGTVSIGSAVGNGTITSGGTSTGTVPLYINVTTNNLTMNSAIANNSSGGVLRLVFTNYLGGQLTLASSLNSYGGGTVVNNYTSGATGSLVVGAAGYLPAGGITINNGILTQTSGGTIASQLVTLNGGSTLTLAGNNTLTGIAFNNNGGTATPTVATGGTLTLPGSGLSASSSNPGTTAAISAASTVSFGGSPATITVSPITINGQSVAPWQATLNISGVLTNATGLTVAGGGNLQLGGQNTFTGGTTVDTTLGPTGLIIGASSTPSTVGSTVTSGPVGTGTLTLGNSAVLVSTAAANTLANNVVLGNNLTFNGAANNLTLNGTVALPAGSSTITVAAPQVTLTLGGAIGGVGSTLVKSGYGALDITNAASNNTFDSGVTLNSGILLATGSNALNPQPLGIGPITLNGGQLQLHNNSFRRKAAIRSI